MQLIFLTAFFVCALAATEDILSKSTPITIKGVKKSDRLRTDEIESIPTTYEFKYSTGSEGPAQLYREEYRDHDGTVKGKYGYVDPHGKLRVVEYSAGAKGYSASGDIGPDIDALNEAQLGYRNDPAVKQQEETWSRMRSNNWGPNYNRNTPPLGWSNVDPLWNVGALPAQPPAQQRVSEQRQPLPSPRPTAQTPGERDRISDEKLQNRWENTNNNNWPKSERRADGVDWNTWNDKQKSYTKQNTNTRSSEWTSSVQHQWEQAQKGNRQVDNYPIQPPNQPTGGQWAQQPPGPTGGQWSQQPPGSTGGQWSQQPPGPTGGQWSQQPPGPTGGQWSQQPPGSTGGQWSQQPPGPTSGQWSQQPPGLTGGQWSQEPPIPAVDQWAQQPPQPSIADQWTASRNSVTSGQWSQYQNNPSGQQWSQPDPQLQPNSPSGQPLSGTRDDNTQRDQRPDYAQPPPGAQPGLNELRQKWTGGSTNDQWVQQPGEGSQGRDGQQWDGQPVGQGDPYAPTRGQWSQQNKPNQPNAQQWDEQPDQGWPQRSGQWSDQTQPQPPVRGQWGQRSGQPISTPNIQTQREPDQWSRRGQLAPPRQSLPITDNQEQPPAQPQSPNAVSYQNTVQHDQRGGQQWGRRQQLVARRGEIAQAQPNQPLPEQPQVKWQSRNTQADQAQFVAPQEQPQAIPAPALAPQAAPAPVNEWPKPPVPGQDLFGVSPFVHFRIDHTVDPNQPPLRYQYSYKK